jgi:pentatricopeptide repeat protein
MSRLLPRRLLSTCITGEVAASLYELASLLTEGRFHRSVDLAKSLLLSSHAPGASAPDLYHALAATLAAGDGSAVQGDPRTRNLLGEAASALVVASARLGHPDGALRLLSLLADAGPGDGTRALLPSLSSCNLLLESLISLGRHADARAAFDLLLVAGAQPDTFAWNKAIQACVAAGDLDEALVMLRRMGRDGAPLADAFSYNVVIAVLWRAGKGNEALKVFDEMVERVVRPNRITYNTMIDGYVKGGDLEGGLKLRDRMVRDGLKPNVITYNVLLSGLCCVGRIGELRNLLDEMESHRLLPDCFTYSILFDGLSRTVGSRAMLSLFGQSLKKGVIIGSYTCSILLNGLCKDGKVAEAEQVLQMLVHTGLVPTRVIYNTLISDYFQIRDFKRAFSVFVQMKSHQISPDHITYNALINGLCKTEMITKAESLVTEMEENGVDPSVETFNTLIDAYGRAGKLEKCLIVLSDGVPSLLGSPLLRKRELHL